MKKVKKTTKIKENKGKSLIKGSKTPVKPSSTKHSSNINKTPHKPTSKGNLKTTNQKTSKTNKNRREVVAVTIHYKQPR